jgi:hypothetical protein
MKCPTVCLHVAFLATMMTLSAETATASTARLRVSSTFLISVLWIVAAVGSLVSELATIIALSFECPSCKETFLPFYIDLLSFVVISVDLGQSCVQFLKVHTLGVCFNFGLNHSFLYLIRIHVLGILTSWQHMRWQLIVEEFGPKLTYIKGASNIVADALTRMRLTETDFGPEVFATDAEAGDFPANFPLSYKQLANAQGKDRKIQASLKTKAGKEKFMMKTFRHSDKSYELVTKDDKIVIPKSLQRKATEWYRTHLLHPGETRLELTLKQHFTFIGLKPMCVKVCKACQVHRTLKKSNKNYGELPPKKNPELIP